MRVPPGPVGELRERRGAAVVDHADGQAEPLLEHLPEGDVVDRRVDGAERDARPRVDPRRDAEPDRLDLRRAQLDDHLDERVEQLLLRLDGRRPLASAARGAPSRRGRRRGSSSRRGRSRSRACRPRRRVPYFAGWRRTTSPIASTGVVASRARCRRCPASRALSRIGPRRRPAGRARAAAAAACRPASLEAHRPDRRCSVLVVVIVVWGDHGLPLLPERRLGREQAVRPRARRAGRAREEQRLPARPRDDDPAARHRQLDGGRAQRRPPRRLDHARPHRSVAPPARLPLDPARPAREHPRGREHEDQRGLPGRRRRARDQDGERASPASRSTTW